MTIKELLTRFPEINAIHWVSPCDWLANGVVTRDQYFARAMKRRAHF